MSGGGILLEAAEMASDDLLYVDAGGMVGKDKSGPIAVVGGKRRGGGQSAGDESDPAEDPVRCDAGEALIEEEGGHCRGPFVEVGIVRIDAMEMKKLGERNEVFTGSG
eukprot:g29456.t1